MFKSNRSLWKKTGTVFTSLVVIAVLLFGNVTSAFAAPAIDDGDGLEDRIEDWYQREALAIDALNMHLDHAVDISGSVQAWIDLMSEQGFDVGDLEAARAAYDVAIAEAQGYRDEATAILIETHAGFDADGKVTDIEQAVETLRSTRDSMRNARRTLVDAVTDLRRSITDWRIEQRESRG